MAEDTNKDSAVEEENIGAVEQIDEFDEDGGEIRESDIMFDCPHCGKRLVIEGQAAGMTINCPQCGELVEVPIPEGTHLSDFDLSPDDLRQQLGLARTACQNAEFREKKLLAEIEKLKELTEKAKTAELFFKRRLSEILAAIDGARRSTESATSQLVKTADAIRSELDKI